MFNMEYLPILKFLHTFQNITHVIPFLVNISPFVLVIKKGRPNNEERNASGKKEVSSATTIKWI